MGQGVRDILDSISHSVIQFLEEHSGICEVNFTERQGVSDA
jgi:hypothetical protein